MLSCLPVGNNLRTQDKEGNVPNSRNITRPCVPPESSQNGSARAKYIAALNDAGTDPQKFVSRFKMLAHQHEWEGGQCDFPSIRLCTCGQCE